MQLALLPIPTIGLAGLRLVSASELMPNIAIAKSAPNNLGVYRITNDGLSIIFDASKIKACQAIKLEISKPNFFYEGLSEQEAKDATMTTIVQRGAQGQVTIPRKAFESPGYYELRAHCLTDKGDGIGEYSDPLTAIRED